MEEEPRDGQGPLPVMAEVGGDDGDHAPMLPGFPCPGVPVPGYPDLGWPWPRYLPPANRDLS